MSSDDLPGLGPNGGLPDVLPAEPMTMLRAWYDDGMREKATRDPDAIVLATATPDGAPSARVVLCKKIDAGPGEFVFYTNYTSHKGRELDANPRAAIVFHWNHAGRQARVEGGVARCTAAESDAYFASRALLSRIGAWASDQSKPMSGRDDLMSRVGEVMARFGVGLEHLMGEGATVEIPRPQWWGGYRLRAERVELWAGAEGRLHDRAEWTRTATGWTARRLFP